MTSTLKSRKTYSQVSQLKQEKKKKSAHLANTLITEHNQHITHFGLLGAKKVGAFYSQELATSFPSNIISLQ